MSFRGRSKAKYKSEEAEVEKELRRKQVAGIKCKEPRRCTVKSSGLHCQIEHFALESLDVLNTVKSQPIRHMPAIIALSKPASVT